jgi:four helix bundle protein
MKKFNKGYEDLQVWQKAIFLAEQIYIVTKTFPKDEIYGMTSQMRRCAVSIASNIAEGCARNNPKEFIQFLGIASGSAAELKTQLIISERIGLLDKNAFDNLLTEATSIERMLAALGKSIAKPATCNLQLAT